MKDDDDDDDDCIIKEKIEQTLRASSKENTQRNFTSVPSCLSSMENGNCGTVEFIDQCTQDYHKTFVLSENEQRKSTTNGEMLAFVDSLSVTLSFRFLSDHLI